MAINIQKSADARLLAFSPARHRLSALAADREPIFAIP
jgi:hypothetical protein